MVEQEGFALFAHSDFWQEVEVGGLLKVGACYLGLPLGMAISRLINDG